MPLHLKNTEKDVIMTDEDEKHYENINNCRICGKEIYSDKLRDQSQLTSD